MIILRQNNYTSIGFMQDRKLEGDDMMASSNYRERFRSSEMYYNDKKSEKKLFDSLIANIDDAAGPDVKRRHDGKIVIRAWYGDKLKDVKHRKNPSMYISSRGTSYKNAYRDFLRNERKLYDSEEPGVNPQTSRYGNAGKLSNENIKNEIRKIAKKEKFKTGIGIAGGAALVGTGAYLIHKHRKKKKESKENKENKNDNTKK